MLPICQGDGYLGVQLEIDDSYIHTWVQPKAEGHVGA